ncbi:hypothetical protein [Streptomyces sp. NBC_00102]|uniref:hypothetical protein n=1 Tax=Streptomyces sp. NBC_00102 TaxID=2975652 RepID=UPI00225533E6|nr:hypothetical protein [Streptomyces sp. NBC_00102]MCX5400802.1 hypothetical protein [Streptomyces sp. NBC_00102]
MNTDRSPDSPRHEARPQRATLERHGRLDWARARALLDGTVCAWADLGGFHLAPAAQLPEETPDSTHLWAWDADRCLRVRFDGPWALTASLRTDDRTGGAPDGATGRPEDVGVLVRPGTAWSPDEKHAGPLAAGAYALRFELLELTGPSPVTFVRALPT